MVITSVDVYRFLPKNNSHVCNQISVEVSGAKTQAIFDDVFDKMVAAARPIPRFRRVKGGRLLSFVNN